MTLELSLAHGSLRLPAFLPDATRGAVRATDLASVRAVGIEALMVNAFHVMNRPGADRIRRLGGLHEFIGWRAPIVTDSGGFQALSLIRENPRHGQILDKGLSLRLPDADKKLLLTPEKSIRTQWKLGSDVMIALDDCTGIGASRDEAALSVERTLRWSRQCKAEFDRQLEQRRIEGPRPLLIGVVQGGDHADLRERCAGELCELGFDGLGFGGWPVDAEGAFSSERFAQFAALLPAGKPGFALGIGKPEHLCAVGRLGSNFVFDCTIPTRDARHQRLYVFEGAPADAPAVADRSFYRCLYMLDDKHAGDTAPLEAGCDCPCCAEHSRAYLHHLFKVGDPQALRLASLHNLRFYARLVEALRGAHG